MFLSVKQKRMFIVLAFAIAALCALLPRPTYADPMSVTLGPSQDVELWREVSGRQPEGVGPNARAGRLIPGATFTDHIVVKNLAPYVTNSMAFVAYWSSPSMEFVNWEGKNWTVEQTPDPERYMARYWGQTSEGAMPGEIGELKVTFRVKPNLFGIKNPQAVHALDYLLNVGYAPGTGRDNELLSQIVLPKPNTFYGWGASKDTFLYEQREAFKAFPLLVLKTEATHPFRVQSFDGATPTSTISEWEGVTHLGCQSQIIPDIRIGEVTYIQSDCVSPEKKYPFLRSTNIGSPVGAARFALVAAKSSDTRVWSMSDDGYYLTVTGMWEGSLANIKIPANQALQLSWHDGFASGTFWTWTIWHNGTQWVYQLGEAKADESSPLYSLWNLNYIHFDKDGPIVYREMPFRKPIS